MTAAPFVAPPGASPGFIAAQDPEGIRLAALEIFERSLHDREVERALSQAARHNGMALLESMAPEPRLSPGYGLFVGYLLWLEQTIDSGAAFALRAEEAEGLRSLLRARREFQRDHPPCYACGALQDHRFARSCRECGKEFRR